MPGSAASFTASSNQVTLARSTPRSFFLLRAATATTSIGRPSRAVEPVAMLVEQFQDAGADGAEAGDAETEGLGMGY